VFEHVHADDVLVASACDANHVAEFVDGVSSVASSTEAIEGENTRIVPSINIVLENLGITMVVLPSDAVFVLKERC
jgi:hypothetical protein